jgi:subtilisin family serine protease/photosystem II stability/assembly factor-like uncharacterized protein
VKFRGAGIICALFLLTFSNVHAQAPIPQTVTPSQSGIVYIQFKSGSGFIPGIAGKRESEIQNVGGSKYQRVLEKIGATQIMPFDPLTFEDSIAKACGIDRMYTVSYSKDVVPIDAAQLFLASGEIMTASPRYLFSVAKITNDPDLTDEWGLLPAVMNVEGAWDITTGDTNIKIADVDMGVNYNHEDLKGNIDLSHSWNFTNSNNNPFPGPVSEMDADHGTMTAGCLAAVGDNGLGIAGVAYGCKVIAIRADDGAGHVGFGYEGIQWGIEHKARVINCSWGGPIDPTSIGFASGLIQEATAYNALIVAAAGNNKADIDVTPFAPGSLPGVFCVGATDRNDQVAADFSNFGHRVNVYAPGTEIYTTDYPGNNAYNSSTQGTSFACPYVAGIVALIMSVHPDWPVKIIAQQIINTCDRIVGTTDTYNYWGRVNAANALATPTLPGLGITAATVNGKANGVIDTIGKQSTLTLTLKNFVGAGQGLSITILPSLGVGVGQPTVQLNSMAADETRQVSFTLSRTEQFSAGSLPLYFAVSDNSTYRDTLSISVLLKPQTGFVFVDSTNDWCTGVKQASTQSAWLCRGYDDSISIWSNFSFESGASWNTNAGLVNNSREAAWCVESLDDQTAWFGVANRRDSLPPMIVMTPDDGSSWTTKNVSSITPYINSIHFFDPTNGIFIGDPKSGNWGIAFSHDGGKTWNPTNIPQAALGGELGWNNSICWVRNNGWFGTNKAEIYKTTNGGLRWTTSNVVSNCVGIGFDDDSLHGFAVCRPATKFYYAKPTGSNALMSSTDGGAHWTTISMPVANSSPSDVKFVPEQHIALLLTNAGVFKTTNFGKSWTLVGAPAQWIPDPGWLSIASDNGQFVATAVSEFGAVSYGEPVTIEGVSNSSNVATSTELLQNAPNPLAGKTTFYFNTGSRERVTLNVYDALGRTVANVLDGTVDAGKHTAAFNASHLPSGVYEYVLETELGIRIARQMTVVK